MKKPDENVDLLRRLERAAQEDPKFSPEEAETLRKVIEAYRAWSMLGRMTKVLVATLAAISGLIVAVSTAMEKLGLTK